MGWINIADVISAHPLHATLCFLSLCLQAGLLATLVQLMVNQ